MFSTEMIKTESFYKVFNFTGKIQQVKNILFLSFFCLCYFGQVVYLRHSFQINTPAGLTKEEWLHLNLQNILDPVFQTIYKPPPQPAFLSVNKHHHGFHSLTAYENWNKQEVLAGSKKPKPPRLPLRNKQLLLSFY